MTDPELLEDEDLRRVFGTPTLERGRDYALREQVLEVSEERDEDGDLDLWGSVAGSEDRPYAVSVSLGHGRAGPWLAARCSCPVGVGCKHAVALVLTVRDRRVAAGAQARGGWEHRLGSLLDALEEQDTPTGADVVPLALQVELQGPSGGRRRGWMTDSQSRRGWVRVRPLRRGARDNWVRTGVSWREVDLGATQGQHDPAQTAVLREMLHAYRAATRQTYLGSETHLSLGSFGPGLWRLLERADEAGVALVPGPGIAVVTHHREPVELHLDVNAAPGEEAQLRLGALLDEQWYGPGDLDVLGETGHGLALWSAEGRHWALRLAPLSRPAGPEVRRLLAREEPLVIPADERDHLVGEYLPRLHRHVPVLSSDASVAVPELPEPRLAVRVTWAAVDEVRLAWGWRYRAGGEDAEDRAYGLAEPPSRHGVRRPEAEQRVLAALDLDKTQAGLLCHGGRGEAGLLPEPTLHHEDAIAFAEDVLPGLRERVEVDEVGDRPDYRAAQGPPEVSFATREAGPSGEQADRTDWLDLEVVVSVDGHQVALAQVLEALTLGRERLVLDNGVHVGLDHPEFSRLAEAVAAAGELVEQPPDGVRVGSHDLGLWEELAEVGVVDAQAAQWVRAAQALRGLDTLPEAEPTGLKVDLRDYQHDGFRWLAFLWQGGLGGILADDMGLGKTLQTLALVGHARERGAGPFLVVAPASVVPVWAGEAAACAPGLDVRVVQGSQSRRGTAIADLADGADVVVTSYTLLRLEADAYTAYSWGGLVLDEAQAVKNHRGKTYQTVRRLDAGVRMALTGTPMENRLIELWSLLSIVAPGLYPWPQRFTEQVANPVEKEGDAEVLARFRRRIRPFLLRRTKELVAADLPPKQEQVLEVTLTPRHRRVYDTHLQRERQTVLGLVEDFERHRIAIFRSLTRLRQLSLHAGLVDDKHDQVASAKIDMLVEHLVEISAEGHRALVFSQFTSFLTRVRSRLEREGLATAYLDGRTRNRDRAVAAFRDGDAPVFLISLKAGGVGLTLTEADYCFVLDPWWNPAVEAQAVDRAHRIGQDKPVMVYRLVATDTIEEKVMELKQRKAALFSQVVDEDAMMAQALGAEDVRALLE